MKSLLIPALISSLLIPLAFAEAPLVRMQGGTTWEKVLTPDKIQEVEKQCGVKLEVAGTGTARSLKHLMEGKADISMFAGTFEKVIKKANEKDPGTVSASDIKNHPIKDLEVVMVVHESNPVSQLTVSQAVKVLNGTVRNWKEVGGKDEPVMVVMASPGEGARFEAEDQFLGGKHWATDAREMQLAIQVPTVVSQVAGGVGTVPVTHLTLGIKRIKIGKKILLPLSLVLKKDDSSKDHKCIISAVKKIVKNK